MTSVDFIFFSFEPGQIDASALALQREKQEQAERLQRAKEAKKQFDAKCGLRP